MIKILGAGLGGLSAGINLIKSGKEVTVYEKNSSVGKQIHPNMQGFFDLNGKVKEYLNNLNLNPKFVHNPIKQAIFCTRNRDINITLKEPVDLVLRGSEKSLEYGLYEEAKKLGVKFEFNKTIENSDIIATGSYKCDIAGYGEIYEDLNLDKGKFLYMHDDRFSPIGLYLYIIPLPDGKFEVVNCTSRPYTNQTKTLLQKATKQRPIIRDIIGKQKPIEHFGGVGSFEFKRARVVNNKIYVGEAAGFQDIFRGFGMKYALESGYLAAKSILENLDYEKLWREQFLARLKKDMSRRGGLRLVGDNAIERLFRNLKDGDVLDWNEILPRGIKEKLTTLVFYRYELYKKWRTGFW